MCSKKNCDLGHKVPSFHDHWSQSLIIIIMCCFDPGSCVCGVNPRGWYFAEDVWETSPTHALSIPVRWVHVVCHQATTSLGKTGHLKMSRLEGWPWFIQTFRSGWNGGHISGVQFEPNSLTGHIQSYFSYRMNKVPT